MSLAGIAISIGVLVDGAIVEVENAYKKLELWIAGGRKGDFHAVRLEALLGGRPVGLLLAAGDRGRVPADLHARRPGGAALQAARLDQEPDHGDRRRCSRITLDPALRMLFTRMDFVHFRPRWLAWLVNQVTVGRYYPEEKHPISRVLFAVYEPACRVVLRHPRTTIAAAVADRGHDGPGLPRSRPRVHAAAQRGGRPLHADDAARDLGHRGEPAAADPGPAAQDVSRGGARASARRAAPRPPPIPRRSR